MEYNENIIVYSKGPLACSVCAKDNLTIEEITAELNTLDHPSTINGWQPAEDKTFMNGSTNPCECDQEPNRKHYLFHC